MKKDNDRTPLERGIDDKESQFGGKRLHGDRLTLHLMKQEQRSRDDAREGLTPEEIATVLSLPLDEVQKYFPRDKKR